MNSAERLERQRRIARGKPVGPLPRTGKKEITCHWCGAPVIVDWPPPCDFACETCGAGTKATQEAGGAVETIYGYYQQVTEADLA